jgi:anti-anti-sigma factor
MLTGDPDTDELKSQLEALIDAKQKKILLNLEETTFMTSRAFGVVIVAHNNAKNHRLALYTCGMQPRVTTVINVIRVAGWPKQFDTRDAALQALSEL